jgi:hypothetical protein
MRLARLVKIAVALWLLRWVAGEAAAYAGRHGGWPKRRQAGTE